MSGLQDTPLKSGQFINLDILCINVHCMLLPVYMHMHACVHVYIYMCTCTIYYGALLHTKTGCRKVAKYFFITTFDPPRASAVTMATNERYSRPLPSEVASIKTIQLQSDSNDVSYDTPSQSVASGRVSHDQKTSHDLPGFGCCGNSHHSNSIVRRYVLQSHVERYVHISTKSFFKHFPTSTRVVLKAKAAVRPDFARFQLVDRRDRTAKTLLESDWLPDECELRGQPFFLRQYYHLTKCVGIAGLCESRAAESTPSAFHFTLSNMSSHREGRCHMLFQLIRAEKNVSN